MNGSALMNEQSAAEREEVQDIRIITLVRAVVEIIHALHSSSVECCQCPLNGSPVCYGYGDTTETVSDILENEGGCGDDAD